MNQSFQVSEIPLQLLKDDHSHQSSAILMFRELAIEPGKAYKVLDLGCGTGGSEEWMMHSFPSIDWHGIDLVASPEVSMRTKQHRRIYSYDGVNLPFEDQSFDIVFTRQVLEHVERPYELMIEVGRVLKSGGYLVGSVSQLEPYHSYSIFNWTPYALQKVLEPAGLQLQALRPGIDGFTLILRSLFMKKFFSRYFEKESPVNSLLEIAGRMMRIKTSSINALKIKLCGHLCFLARRQ